MTKFLALRGGAASAFVLVGLAAPGALLAQSPAAPPASTPAPSPAPVAPAIAPSSGDDKITVNFVNADIQSVIKTVGQHTGRNFILDPRVTGTVNIVSDRPVNRELLYQIFLSALRVQGYAAVEEGGFVKIIPEAEAKASAGPVGEQAARIPGDRIVTQVFMLQNENSADVQIVRLANASAIDIGQMLQRVVPETSPSPTAPGTPPKAAVAVDARTNSLVIRADSPALMARIKSLALGLDTPGAGTGNIYVVFLRNAEAARIADTLRGLMSGSESSRTTTTSTTPAGNTATQTTASTTTGGGAIPAAAPSSIIQAYPPTNSIIITATEPVYRSLRTVIDQLDQRRQQVYIEALIVEVSTGRAAEFGVQWNAGRNIGGGQTVFGGTNFSTTTGSNILGVAAGLSGTDPLAAVGAGLNLGLIRGTLKIPGTDIEIANLQVLARALEGDSGANVLSTPNMLTLDNEEEAQDLPGDLQRDARQVGGAVG